MSGAMREKDSADFDLETFIDLFDEAITSDDPSVQKTLQHLMVIVALARNHNQHDQRNGPLRRLFEDVRDMNRRLSVLESGQGYRHGGYGPVPSPGIWPGTPLPGTPANPIWTAPTTTTQWPPRPGTYPPGTIFGQNIAQGGGNNGIVAPTAISQSTTSYAWDPLDNTSIAKKVNSGGGLRKAQAIAERAEDLLKNQKYKGSSLGTVDVKTS